MVIGKLVNTLFSGMLRCHDVFYARRSWQVG